MVASSQVPQDQFELIRRPEPQPSTQPTFSHHEHFYRRFNGTLSIQVHLGMLEPFQLGSWELAPLVAKLKCSKGSLGCLFQIECTPKCHVNVLTDG